MSKLDDIFEWDSLANLHREVKAIAKGKIKNLMKDLIDDCAFLDDEQRDAIREKVNEL